jgi:hypothetical protein
MRRVLFRVLACAVAVTVVLPSSVDASPSFADTGTDERVDPGFAHVTVDASAESSGEVSVAVEAENGSVPSRPSSIDGALGISGNATAFLLGPSSGRGWVSAWLSGSYAFALEPSSEYEVFITLDVPTEGIGAPAIGATPGPLPYEGPSESRGIVYLHAEVGVVDGDGNSNGSGSGKNRALACTGGVDPGGTAMGGMGVCDNPGTVTLVLPIRTYGTVSASRVQVEVGLDAAQSIDRRDGTAWARGSATVTDIRVERVAPSN